MLTAMLGGDGEDELEGEIPLSRVQLDWTGVACGLLSIYISLKNLYC